MDLHACYLAELAAGEVVRIAVQHLDHDPRRARLMLTMHTVADGRLAATVELLLINMHVEARKPVPWSAHQLSRWQSLSEAHATIAMPRQAGRAIGTLSGRA
jgi:acyl-CoA thioester hydrolase